MTSHQLNLRHDIDQYISRIGAVDVEVSPTLIAAGGGVMNQAFTVQSSALTCPWTLQTWPEVVEYVGELVNDLGNRAERLQKALTITAVYRT